MRKILICLLPALLLSGCANSGRFQTLHTSMYSCGFRSAAFHKFHDCMEGKVTVSESDTHDYYYSTAKEIQATLDDLEQQVRTKKLKQAAAYSQFDAFVTKRALDEQKSAQIAGAVTIVALAGVGAVSCAHSAGCRNAFHNGGGYQNPPMCSACPGCSPQCNIGKACGNTCISAMDTCHLGAGSACNLNWRSYP